jgi:cytidylate kinase
MTRTQRIQKRNKTIKKEIDKILDERTESGARKFTKQYAIEQVAEKHFLSITTVEQIYYSGITA